MKPSKKHDWSWKHNSGDNEPTLDWYLWFLGKPTNNLISQASGVYYCYINGEEKYMADSLNDAKEWILKRVGLQ